MTVDCVQWLNGGFAYFSGRTVNEQKEKTQKNCQSVGDSTWVYFFSYFLYNYFIIWQNITIVIVDIIEYHSAVWWISDRSQPLNINSVNFEPYHNSRSEQMIFCRHFWREIFPYQSGASMPQGASVIDDPLSLRATYELWWVVFKSLASRDPRWSLNGKSQQADSSGAKRLYVCMYVYIYMLCLKWCRHQPTDSRRHLLWLWPNCWLNVPKDKAFAKFWDIEVPIIWFETGPKLGQPSTEIANAHERKM